jgi:uncharacterized protein
MDDRRRTFFAPIAGMALLLAGEARAADPLPCDGYGCADLCEKGNAAACVSLGSVHLMGVRPKKADPSAARAAFQRACAKGDGVGCLEVARMAQLARETPAAVSTRFTEAHKLLESACASGDGRSCYHLAHAHVRGDPGLKSSEGSHLPLLQKACKAKHPGACAKLAGLDEVAHEQKPTKESRKLQRRSFDLNQALCKKRDVVACENVALAYQSGIGTKKSEKQAKRFHTMACTMGLAAHSCAQAR